MIPLNGKGKFLQGIFKPRNPKKYIGKETPIYRSGWELKFFRWADTNPNILEWASEAIIVPYRNPLDGQIHRYYTDGVVLIKEGDKLTKYVIEIKPSSQTVPPVATKRKKQSSLIYETRQYAVNTAKWSAAQTWADQHGYKFLILTEKHLGIGI
jgi:hypothetical protein